MAAAAGPRRRQVARSSLFLFFFPLSLLVLCCVPAWRHGQPVGLRQLGSRGGSIRPCSVVFLRGAMADRWGSDGLALGEARSGPPMAASVAWRLGSAGLRARVWTPLCRSMQPGPCWVPARGRLRQWSELRGQRVRPYTCAWWPWRTTSWLLATSGAHGGRPLAVMCWWPWWAASQPSATAATTHGGRPLGLMPLCARSGPTGGAGSAHLEPHGVAAHQARHASLGALRRPTFAGAPNAVMWRICGAMFLPAARASHQRLMQLGVESLSRHWWLLSSRWCGCWAPGALARAMPNLCWCRRR